jgi:ribosomal protein S8
MHNLKFCNKLISMLTLTFKQNHIWFDIILTKNIFSLLLLFQTIGIVSSFYIFKKNFKNFLKVFVKYINLEIQLCFPIFFYFKPSHKLPITLKKLKKINVTMGTTVLVISTSKGLMTHDDCLKFNISGYLFLIIYV